MRLGVEYLKKSKLYLCIGGWGPFGANYNLDGDIAHRRTIIKDSEKITIKYGLAGCADGQ